MENKSANSDQLFRKNVSRFVSTFASAFRSFYLYQQDNRAFDEMMQNLARRFQESVPAPKSITLGITNRSFLFEGEPSGFRDVSVSLAAQLRSLGYKEIGFQSPIQPRNFFQLLHVLSSKESDEAKNEKLLALMADGETKPISLVPITANTAVVRLPDQLITVRLSSLSIPEAMGGTSFLEKLTDTRLDSLADFFSWVTGTVEMFPPAVRNFVQNITDATREGYFPFERFLRLFPMPRKLREDYLRKIDPAPDNRPRKTTPLAHAFSRVGQKGPIPPKDWASLMLVFTEAEVKELQSYRFGGEALPAAQDLDLAEALLKQQGADMTLGLSFLTRFLNEKNPVAIQEKALRIAMDLWSSHQTDSPNPEMSSILSSLRQYLTMPHNVILSMFPLRNTTMDSTEFRQTTTYIASLGKVVIPGLISALETEQDRGMRKKLCQVLMEVSRQFGIESLVSVIPKASPFLLRNLVMILGDIRNPLTIPDLVPLLRSDQKMVRVEAVRTLAKIGTEEATRHLLPMLEQTMDQETRQAIVDYFVQLRLPAALEIMMRHCKHPAMTSAGRKSFYTAIAAFGGSTAKTFFEQILKEGGFMTRFNTDQKEEQELVKSLISRMSFK